MSTLKLKAVLISKDGGITWEVIRQYYLATSATEYSDTVLEGRRLALFPVERRNVVPTEETLDRQ